MRLLLLCFLLSGSGYGWGVLGLRCRSQDGASDAELKRVVRSCMQRAGQDGQDAQERQRYGSGRNSYDEDYAMGQGQGQGQGQGRGQERGQGQQQQQSYGNRWQRSPKQRDNNNNNSTEMGGCVAQCFLEELSMVDGNGQPDRRKVSYLLTKDLRDRELRNFYMDTVQECFRYLEHFRYSSSSGSSNNNNNNNGNSNNNNNSSKCSQSRELIKCMSEYAKAQCDDWEDYGNVLFN